MKHPFSVTALLVFLFLAAQIIGLSLLAINIKEVATIDGAQVVVHDTTTLGDRPQLQGGQSALYLLIGVAIGTALILLLIKFRIFRLWKIWFFLAVWLSMS